MKKLILLSVLVIPTFSSANEIMDGSEGKQIVSQIKDIQVKDMLEKTGEFNECREKYPFKANDSESDRTDKLKQAEKCFRDKLAKETNKEKLKELSENLNLQPYGLVQSQNLKDIQNYLADKMYESMTGVNRKEADKKKLIESMKFGKKKNIDQKTFIEMYKTQLGKNALFEVSRFCFENFRSTAYANQTPPTNFAAYWKPHISSLDETKTGNVTDDGNPSFGNFTDATDKNKIYQDIFTNIQGSVQLTDSEMSAFFMKCGKLITKLCDDFSKNKDVTEAGTKSQTGATTSKGANACLAKSRIQDYRLALKNAEKVEEYFAKEMTSSSKALGLVLAGAKGEPIKIFGKGGDDEASVDDLTNNTASSILEGNYNKDQAKLDKLDECAQAPELTKCEGVISQGDQLEKAKHTVDLEMTLKRDVEMARVRELVAGDKKDLKEYLEDGGYFEILKEWEAGKLNTPGKIEELIGQAFEAKKEATLAEINNKLGSRQIKKDQKITDPGVDVAKAVKETKEERARLAQVVLFNNIITSTLSLKKKDASGNLSDAGRNVNAWKKEEQALDGKVDQSYFANIKKTTDGAKGIGKDSQIAGFEILDEFLGKN
jgi:hypothetical protein